MGEFERENSKVFQRKKSNGRIPMGEIEPFQIDNSHGRIGQFQRENCNGRNPSWTISMGKLHREKSKGNFQLETSNGRILLGQFQRENSNGIIRRENTQGKLPMGQFPTEACKKAGQCQRPEPEAFKSSSHWPCKPMPASLLHFNDHESIF